MTSVLNVDEIAAKNGTDPVALTKQAALKGFQIYNGTGTPAIGDSLNTSSITDSGVGQYKPNFTNAYSSTNYSNTHGATYTTGNGWYHWYNTVTTGAIDHNFIETNGNYADASHISGMQTGDLA
jgi:hypothetical protein